MKSWLTRFSDALSLIAFAACIALLVVNLHLRRINESLSAQVQSFEAGSAPAVGSQITSLNGTGLNGSPMHLDLGHREDETLLLVMSPSCPYCAKTLPAWKDLVGAVGTKNVVYVDLSGTLTAAYFRGAGIGSTQNAISVAPEEKLLHGFFATPTTILLSKNGRVDASWAGVLGDSELTTFYQTIHSKITN